MAKQIVREVGGEANYQHRGWWVFEGVGQASRQLGKLVAKQMTNFGGGGSLGKLAKPNPGLGSW